MKDIKKILLVLICCNFWVFTLEKVSSQEVQNPPQEPLRHSLFFQTSNEARELRQKHRQESIELRNRKKTERKEALERHRILRKETKEKYKKEREEKANNLKTKKAIKENLNKSSRTEKLKNKAVANEKIKEQDTIIRKTKKSGRYIEIITNENDPLFIASADVLNAKTEFLKIKDVEFKYKIKVQNQTPKIINSALIIWERELPFNPSQTILKETTISKPFIPYEKRIIEYNDLNSKREGESYKVKVANVIFEDGTQWKNPNL